MNAIFLNEAGGDFQKHFIAEKGHEMHIHPLEGSLHVLRTALPQGDDLEFEAKLLRRLPERLPDAKDSGATLSFEFQIPIFRKVLRVGETFLLGRFPPVLASKKSGALPIGTIFPRYTCSFPFINL